MSVTGVMEEIGENFGVEHGELFDGYVMGL